MDFSADHAGFVVAAYGISAFVLLLLVARFFWHARKLAAKLKAAADKA